MNTAKAIEELAVRTDDLNQQIHRLRAQAKQLPTRPMGLICFGVPLDERWSPTINLVLQTLGKAMGRAFPSPFFRLAAWGPIHELQASVGTGFAQLLLVRDYEEIPLDPLRDFEGASHPWTVAHADCVLYRALTPEQGPLSQTSLVLWNQPSPQGITCVVAPATNMRVLLPYDLRRLRSKLGDIVPLVFTDKLDNPLAQLGKTVFVDDTTIEPGRIVQEAILGAIDSMPLFKQIAGLRQQLHAWRMELAQLCNMRLE